MFELVGTPRLRVRVSMGAEVTSFAMRSSAWRVSSLSSVGFELVSSAGELLVCRRETTSCHVSHTVERAVVQV